jgi:hypothetical protein
MKNNYYNAKYYIKKMENLQIVAEPVCNVFSLYLIDVLLIGNYESQRK